PYYMPPTTPALAASTLIPVDVALGNGDYYDVASLWSDELGSTELYYRLLNCGFRLPAAAGTDNFSDVWRDPPPGSDRTYVHVTGRLTTASWIQGLRAQHTFATTGPLVMLQVQGHEPGDAIALSASAPRTLTVRATAQSIAPMEKLDIIVNGAVAATVTASTDSTRLTFDDTVAVPEGGWVAARVLGPESRYVGDDYAFAQTSPVYVVRGGHRFTSPNDARFLSESITALEQRVERAPWRTRAEHDRFMASLEKAKAVYDAIASGSATPGQPARGR
ncbi:MAG: CehA/McbA family metallohydrolase, partial [Gemmatimonadaceae bacterium]